MSNVKKALAGSEGDDFVQREPSRSLAREWYPLARDIGLVIALGALLFGIIYFPLADGPWLKAILATLLGLSGALVLAVLEHITKPAGPRKSSRKWLLHLQLMLGYIITGAVLFSLLAPLPFLISHHLGIKTGFIDLKFDRTWGIFGIVSGSFVAVAASDFFFYWWHRLSHKSKILWQHHKLHHMDPEFDALTYYRNNWVEILGIGLLQFTPSIIFLNATNESIIDAGMVNGVILYLFMMTRQINHANLRIQFGWASVLWTSSQTHRIHHSYLPEHHDKNFAGHFPLWDILFGTYYHPKKDEFPPTGVLGEREISSFWEAQIFPVREWWKMLRSWRDGHNLQEAAE